MTGYYAFPQPDTVAVDEGLLIVEGDTGMSLRDYFAAKAMQGSIASLPDGGIFSMKASAEWAYEVADAMLEARDA